MTTEFTVDARSLTATGGNHVTARVLNPSGAKTDTYVTDNGDGTYRVQYTAYEEGEGLGWAGRRRAGRGRWRSGPSVFRGAGGGDRAHPDLSRVADFQERTWWRCCTMTWPCPRAPSAWA